MQFLEAVRVGALLASPALVRLVVLAHAQRPIPVLELTRTLSPLQGN